MTSKASLANLLVECMGYLSPDQYTDQENLYRKCLYALDPEMEENEYKLIARGEEFYTPTFDDSDFPEDYFSFNSYAETARITATHDDNEMIKSLTAIRSFVAPVFQVQIDKIILFLKLFYLCSGLAGEAGEVLEKVKKTYRNQQGVFATPPEKLSNEKLITEFDIILELGDVLWYSNAIAELIVGENGLEIAAKKNNEKLMTRLKNNSIKSSGDEIDRK